MDDRLNDLATQIFVQMAAQHAVRHGIHGSRVHASALAREAFKLAEAFVEELDAQSAPREESAPSPAHNERLDVTESARRTT